MICALHFNSGLHLISERGLFIFCVRRIDLLKLVVKRGTMIVFQGRDCGMVRYLRSSFAPHSFSDNDNVLRQSMYVRQRCRRGRLAQSQQGLVGPHISFSQRRH